MPFLELADYTPHIKNTNLEAMIETIEQTRTDAENAAISQVRDYLFERYDVDTIFAQTGTNRHRNLVRMCVYIALYILHERLPGLMIPERIENNYTDTLRHLELVARSKIAMDLPRIVDSDGDIEPHRLFASSEPRGN